MVTQVWNVGQGHTDHKVTAIDHVEMNSWYKFGECSTHGYGYIYSLNYFFLLTVFLPNHGHTQAWNAGQGHKPPRDIRR